VGRVLRSVFGRLWGVWGLVSGQDETCSDTKYDVSVRENYKYSKLIANARMSKLKSRLILSESRNE